MPELLIYRPSPEMENYAAAGKCRESAPMKYLYSSDDKTVLQEIITNLTFVRLMKSESLIIPEDDGQVERVNNADLWKPMMADYVSFVCLVNPNFSPECFDSLLGASAEYYEEHCKALMDDFAMDMEEWKSAFAGSLFI